MAKICVIGLGYVGCVSVACFAKSGHQVIGVDIDTGRVQQVNSGQATVSEPKLDDLMDQALREKKVTATTDLHEALSMVSIVMITVGTPSLADGALDLSAIMGLGQQLAEEISHRDNDFLTIAIRSTIKPGTCEALIELIENQSGKKNGRDFAILSNPEFLREGSAVNDFFNPPFVVVGASDRTGPEKLLEVYQDIEAEKLVLPFKQAEIIKYVSNSWHALKVAFANEVGSICAALDIQSAEVMELFFKDKILNISSKYLKPGFAYGGACLPKDLGALVSLAHEQELRIPLLNNIDPSNDAHIARALKLIKDKVGSNHIGLYGLSFKSNTDDLRNSPAVVLGKMLIADGFEVRIFDPAVMNSLENDRNIAATRAILGDLEGLMCNTLDQMLGFCEATIITRRVEGTDLKKVLDSKTRIFDLFGNTELQTSGNERYNLC